MSKGMSTPTDRVETTASERLPRARLAPAGPPGFSPVRWAGRAAGLALLLALAWWTWSWRQPLPEPQINAPDPPPSAEIALFPEPPSIEQRDQLLASLLEQGNLFAPDRQPWKRDRLAEADQTETNKPQSENSQADQTESDSPPTEDAPALAGKPGEPIDIDRIAITPKEKTSVAIRQEMEHLRLRGVYRTDAGPAALISDRRGKHRDRSHIYRPGEAFDEGRWRVLAIDIEQGRVILQRAGVNVQLQMHETLQGATVASASSGGNETRKPTPRVVQATPEDIRRELLEAGVEQSEIEALLQLAQRDSETTQSANKPDQAKKTARDALTDAASIPQAPEGFAELLKMMASGAGPGGEADTSPDDDDDNTGGE